MNTGTGDPGPGTREKQSTNAVAVPGPGSRVPGPRIALIAGEASGDILGAGLIAQLDWGESSAAYVQT